MFKISVVYLSAAAAFAVISVVCSKAWTLDSHIENKLNGLIKNFHSQKVSIFDH